MIAFLQGDSGQAGAMVGQALQAATKLGDVGGQLRYLGAIAAGLLMAGDPRAALGYADKAISVAKHQPDVGFPYPAYSTKILALLALDRGDDAQQLVDVALAQASSESSRIKQVELLMMAATISQRRGLEEEPLSRIEQAVQIAKAGGVQRLLGEAEAERSLWLAKSRCRARDRVIKTGNARVRSPLTMKCTIGMRAHAMRSLRDHRAPTIGQCL